MFDGLNEAEIRWFEEYFQLSEGKESPLALWIIGRPAAGKTTTAMLLHNALRRAGYCVELVDGDTVRAALDGSFGYSAADRLAVFKKYVHINQLLQRRGVIPITATITGFHQFREIVRSSLDNPRFIYLDCPFDVAVRRDQKGSYAKALAGELKNFFDVDIPFEAPVKYEIKIDSARFKPIEIVDIIVEHFQQVGLFRKRFKPYQNDFS